VPDLICGHPGWGELLFLKDVFPEAPLLTYQEFYYQSRGWDLDFDPELQPPLSFHALAKARMKNANVLLNLQASDWCITPTAFQRSSFPALWQPRMSVIHDGINTEAARPNPKAQPLQLPDGTLLQRGEPIITFVNRRLEPYRGCHTFIRAIPRIQALHPSARIVIVGLLQGVSYGAACPQGEWKDQFLAEIEGSYDPSRVHFTGSLPYDAFLHLLQLSAAHAYLTYPFVMSWSLLEAMSSECAVVGSATGPVQEVIDHGRNGMLVDFFDPTALANALVELLNDRKLAKKIGQSARQTVLDRYSLERCVPRQLALLRLVASRSL
jgi:glycosyltransferase involved in cell wall biosynthesis